MCAGTMEKMKHQPLPASTPNVMVPRILNESQHSQAIHPRGIKQLVECRAMDREEFLRTWIRCLQPLFLVSKREPVVERMLKFVASFTAYWDKTYEGDCEHFVEEFLGILLKWVDASHKSVRFRACQMISEVMSKLPEDVPVVDVLWDNIISSMQRRMQDKLPSVRVYAARALSRLVITDDLDYGCQRLKAYRQALESDQSAEVRKMVVLSMPAMNATVADIVERTADINESVRKATYHVLGSKFRLQSLSIMQRVLILQRGLSERFPSVRAECVEMLKSIWLERDCEGSILSLLRCLDVETHEKVGENVMLELLKQELDVKATCSGGLRQFLPSGSETGDEGATYKLLDAEQALYWRMLCMHLHSEAEAKGSDAATTGGAQAVVNAAAAADSNDYLEGILPPTVAEYVHLVEAHVRGGPISRFAARQLLLISKFMDFADNTSRRQAAALLRSLLGAVESIQSERRLEDIVGDGVSLGGDELWANAVAELAHHVHASPGEFVEVVAASLAEHARPCREGGADVMQWLHCLAVTGLLLENIQYLHQIDGQVIEPQEIHDSLLLPAVRHLHPEVQRAGVRCLGIFCCLEKTPSARGVEQLRLCLRLSNRYYVQEMAFKALFDLILCHGATALDHVVRIGSDSSGARPPGFEIRDLFRSTGDISERDNQFVSRLPLLEFLTGSLDPDDSMEKGEELHPITSIAAEGFAKILLQSKRFPEMRVIEDCVLEKLIRLYFSVSTEHNPRLRQCLNVFFRFYCSLSSSNKRAISKVFIPVMRKEWPGIYGNREKLGTVVAARKHAAEIGRFMLLLLQLPLSAKETQSLSNQTIGRTTAQVTETQDADEAINEGHEELAIRICAEVISYFPKKSMAGKTYMATLCRYCTQLEYSASQQEEIKCLYQLLPTVIDSLHSGEKTLLKELKDVRVLLRALNTSPDKDLTDKEIRKIMERLGIASYGDKARSLEVEETPLKASKTTARRRTANASQCSTLIETPVPPSTRTLRQRPTSLQALTKTQALKNQLREKVPRKNLDSLYESGSSDLDSDSPTASSSGSEYEVLTTRKSSAIKASCINSAAPSTSSRIQRASTDSSAAKSILPHDQWKLNNTDSDNISAASVSEADVSEDEATCRPAGRRTRPAGAGASRMRKLEIGRDSGQIHAETSRIGADRDHIAIRSASASECREEISSEEAASISTTAYGKSIKREAGLERSFHFPKSVDLASHIRTSDGEDVTSSPPAARKIPARSVGTARKNNRRTSRSGVTRSSKVVNLFESDNGSSDSDFEPVLPRRRMSHVL